MALMSQARNDAGVGIEVFTEYSENEGSQQVGSKYILTEASVKKD